MGAKEARQGIGLRRAAKEGKTAQFFKGCQESGF